MLLRRIARPFFASWFVSEGLDVVRHPSAHADEARGALTTLLTVATRAGDNLFDLENYVAREQIGDGGESTDAPSAAGGAL